MKKQKIIENLKNIRANTEKVACKGFIDHLYFYIILIIFLCHASIFNWTQGLASMKSNIGIYSM